MFAIDSYPMQRESIDAVKKIEDPIDRDTKTYDFAIEQIGKRKDNLSQKGKEVSDKKTRFHFIYNEYTTSRGEPVMLEITCRKCNQWVMDYQKDGPGDLLRCYTDRIHYPIVLRENSFTAKNVDSAPYLACSNCSNLLGKPFIYQREENIARNKITENRPAYLLLSDSNTDNETPTPCIKYEEKL